MLFFDLAPGPEIEFPIFFLLFFENALLSAVIGLSALLLFAVLGLSSFD
jgi:hypothetical protein